MIDRCDRLRFRQEPPYSRLTLRHVAQHALDGHLAFEAIVRGQLDFAHTTFAEHAFDRVSSRQINDLHVVVSCDRIRAAGTTKRQFVPQALWSLGFSRSRKRVFPAKADVLCFVLLSRCGRDSRFCSCGALFRLNHFRRDRHHGLALRTANLLTHCG